MPPASAIQLGRRHCDVMRYLYGSTARVVASSDIASLASAATPDSTPTLIPWGWNLALRQQLINIGYPSTILPDESWLQQLRRLQHRTTLLPLQPETRWVNNEEELSSILSTTPRLVLKAPWSGSGRGLRWVDGILTEHDILWLRRVIAHQDGVIVEPRRDIVKEIALEYEIRQTEKRKTLLFKGLSLFESRNGVYHGNWMLNDDAIVQQVEQYTSSLPATRRQIENWLHQTIVPHYSGPLGIDLHIDRCGQLFVGEINLRHTMGMVAHALAASHTTWHGRLLSPIALHRVVLSTGSNMGNRSTLLRQAIKKISEQVGVVVAQSSVIETAPWGFDAQRQFLNQVLVVDTPLDAKVVLWQILKIEQELGRQRDFDPLQPPKEHVYHSRPIDIDIIFFDDDIVDSSLLQIPHPRMHLRRFVLEPLCELMPNKVHPVLHLTIKELMDRL